MKKITIENYREDKYYHRLVSAVTTLLERDAVVRPIDVFVEMGLVDHANVKRWRAGQVPYLEKVLVCNFEKAARILRILRIHAHDLHLKPSRTHYKTKGKELRFTKWSNPNLEDAYSHHYVVLKSSKSTNNAINTDGLGQRACGASPIPPVMANVMPRNRSH